MRPRVTAVLSLAGLLLVGAVTPVLAATSVGVDAVVTGDDVAVTIIVNKKPGAISSCSYAVDSGASVSCGTKAALGSKSTRYTVTLNDQSVGGHTIVVTVNLTDGGRSSGSDTFSIAAPPAPRVFARAWTNVDGVAGFNAATDVEIARLEDTNGDDVVSPGDTVRMGGYPTNLAGTTFSTFGVTSHVVATVIAASSGVIAVHDAADNEYGWVRVSTSHEAFAERLAPGQEGPAHFQDGLAGGICTDFVQVFTSAPSAPAQAVLDEETSASACGDRSFVDVSINVL